MNPAKRFVQKETPLWRTNRRGDVPRSSVTMKFLANPGAIEATVAFHPYLAAAEKIGHRSNRLLGVFGAGADGEDEITERKFGPGLEDLGILFHKTKQFLSRMSAIPLL